MKQGESFGILNLFRTSKRPLLSIEIFPPKTETGLSNLQIKLFSYRQYAPDFISITYGAGGSTRSGTFGLAQFIQNELSIPAVSHLTCVNHTETELQAILDEVQSLGIKNIMALRGDPPQGQSAFQAVPGGYSFAKELVKLVSARDGFTVGCAGYPEGHIEATTREQDIDFLKSKVDAGAQFIVSQFFLHNYFFLRFRDELYKKGVRVPLVAGILPISNFNQISKFSLMCGCTIPARVMKGLYSRSDQDQEKFGLDHAANQIQELIREGVDGVHLYALNKHATVETLAPLLR